MSASKTYTTAVSYVANDPSCSIPMCHVVSANSQQLKIVYDTVKLKRSPLESPFGISMFCKCIMSAPKMQRRSMFRTLRECVDHLQSNPNCNPTVQLGIRMTSDCDALRPIAEELTTGLMAPENRKQALQFLRNCKPAKKDLIFSAPLTWVTSPLRHPPDEHPEYGATLNLRIRMDCGGGDGASAAQQSPTKKVTTLWSPNNKLLTLRDDYTFIDACFNKRCQVLAVSFTPYFYAVADMCGLVFFSNQIQLMPLEDVLQCAFTGLPDCSAEVRPIYNSDDDGEEEAHSQEFKRQKQ